MGGEIIADRLIKAVKTRPALYDRNDSGYYCHRKHKSKMWSDVCREVFSNWDNLKPQVKFEYCRELQKRWKSLRTCFTRELALQRKEQKESKQSDDDGPFKKRKRYEYFNQLKFLLGSIDYHGKNEAPKPNSDEDDPLEYKLELHEDSGEETAKKIKKIDVSHDEESIGCDPNLMLETIVTERPFDTSQRSFDIARSSFENNPPSLDGLPFQTNRQSFQKEVPVHFERNQSVEEKIFDILKDFKRDEKNEDRMFLLSLVPFFEKLDPKKKLEAKIEILKVLRQVGE